MLYQQPATPSIARFTGVAGEYTGTVVEVQRGKVVLSLASGQLLTGRAIGEHRIGGPSRLLIRPASTSLSVRRPVEEAAVNCLDATVIDMAYRGRGYDHVVRCDAAVVGGIHAPTAYGRGSRVTLRLDPDQCIAYPDSDGGQNEITTARNASATDPEHPPRWSRRSTL